MTFQPEPGVIRWKLHLKTPPAQVYALLATGTGRAKFWAEAAEENGGEIHFHFPNGWAWRGKILEAVPPARFRLEYYGGSLTTFELRADGSGGTELLLSDEGVPPADRCEVVAGWVSVLMALKAAADFGVDLRNHDPERTWDQGYAEN